MSSLGVLRDGRRKSSLASGSVGVRVEGEGERCSHGSRAGEEATRLEPRASEPARRELQKLLGEDRGKAAGHMWSWSER